MQAGLKSGKSDRSGISIIIPCRNEMKYIDGCLRSVFSFDPVAASVEVIVVDGMSTDSTREILRAWQSRIPELKVLDNPSGRRPSAMNIGLKEARGEWIVRLDAHSEYPRDYLFRCIDAARETGADNVGGVVVTLPGDGSFQAKVVQALTTHRFGVGNSEFRVNTRPGFVDTVPYGCYRREALEEIGRYYEFMELNEDYELNRRLIRAGGRIWLDPAIRIFYYNRASIRGLLGQAYHTGRWNARMWRIAPYAFEIRHSVPGAFVLYLLFALLLGLILEPAAAAILLAPYLALDLASSLQQGSRYGWTLAAPLIFAFPLYHLSYGLGILKGCGEVLLGRVKQDRREDISSPLHAT